MELVKIESEDNLQVQTYSWAVEKPLAIVQIAHGMMEHAGRYDYFARWMNNHQIAVYANDHIGHGLTSNSSAELGHFPLLDDWRHSINILHDLTKRIREENPDVPVFLMGHSMGSVMAQTYMILHGQDTDGYILSGPVRQSGIIASIGILISCTFSILFGVANRSSVLNHMVYGKFNNRIKPKRTAFDWICSEENIVDEYTASPLCGFPCSNRFYQNFFQGFKFISKIKNLKKIPPAIPVFIFAGRMDPAGKFGKDPKKVNYLLSKFARAQVQMNLYCKGRHEMLNEKNREVVYQDLLDWINERISH